MNSAALSEWRVLCPADRLAYLSGQYPSFVEPQLVAWSIRGTVSWESLLRAVEPHRLLPRVCALLRDPRCAPVVRHASARALLEARWRGEQARQLADRSEFEQCASRLNRVGIEPMVLKGGALLETVYRDTPWRAFSDYDVLVRPGQFRSAAEALTASGFQPVAPEPHVPSRWHQRRLGNLADRNAITWSNSRLCLDLHVEAFDSRANAFTLPAGWLWEGALPHWIGRARVWLPHPERLFTHLLLHLMKHRIRGKKTAFAWYVDLHDTLLFHRKQVIGQWCARVVVENPERLQLQSVIAFVREHWSEDLPPALERIVVMASAPGLRQVFGATVLGADAREPIFLEYWRRMRGFRDRAWFVIRWTIPSRRYLRAQYGGGSMLGILVAYLRHILAMVRKGIALAVLLLCGFAHRRLVNRCRMWNNELHEDPSDR